MHCQKELEEDRSYAGFLPDSLLFKWFNDSYSTSKHLFTLYSMARGLEARTILEIGFGRSTFVLARAVHENGGRLIACDTSDFSYLLSEAEKSVTTFICGASDEVWKTLAGGIDLAFLDYFSSGSLTRRFCLAELKTCLSFLKTNGLIAVHDSIVEKYNVRKALKKLAGKRTVEYASLPYSSGLGILHYLGRSPHGELADPFVKKRDSG